MERYNRSLTYLLNNWIRPTSLVYKAYRITASSPGKDLIYKLDLDLTDFHAESSGY